MAESGVNRSTSRAGQPTSLQRQPSFSSFPPSRSPSTRNGHTHKARSPQPPMLREGDDEDSMQSRDSSSPPLSMAAPPRGTGMRAGMRLRSQYPADAIENHVEYILVASFDIDRGSIMEHQYPTAISGDETMLAELMLPDQAHVRSQDWTIFFLHKDTTAEEEEREARRERRRRRRRRREGLEDDGDAAAGAEETNDEDNKNDVDGDDDDDFYDEDGDEDTESESEPDPDGPPLVYVLNLVNTKQDNTVKR